MGCATDESVDLAAAEPSEPTESIAASDALTAAQTSCTVHADCAVVPVSGCCPGGAKLALRASAADAYKDAHACKTSAPSCSFDSTGNLGARCDASTKRCALAFRTPAQTLELAHYTLGTPVRANGKEGGYPAAVIPADELSPAKPADGYSSKYLYADSDAYGRGVTFYCPITGAANSTSAPHPRSELRHQIAIGTNDGFLVGNSTASTMTAKLAVKQVPHEVPGYEGKVGMIIVGQIHGLKLLSGPNKGDNAAPLLLISYTYDFDRKTGVVRAVVKGNPDPDETTPANTSFVLYDDVPLGKPFTYDIRVKSNVVTVNGVATKLSSAWTGLRGYFKAGAYVQEVGDDATEAGRVTFYALDTHAQ